MTSRIIGDPRFSRSPSMVSERSSPVVKSSGKDNHRVCLCLGPLSSLNKGPDSHSSHCLPSQSYHKHKGYDSLSLELDLESPLKEGESSPLFFRVIRSNIGRGLGNADPDGDQPPDDASRFRPSGRSLGFIIPFRIAAHHS